MLIPILHLGFPYYGRAISCSLEYLKINVQQLCGV